jgi:general secretion pathway protein D
MKAGLAPIFVCILAVVLLAGTSSSGVLAQSSSATSAASREHSVPVEALVAAMAKKTGKTFVVDPRVNSDATLIGENPASIDYAQFLAILQVNGYAAVENGGLVRVVPDAAVRYLSVPIVTGREAHPDAEYITKIISVKNTPAALLVPVLRPLMPQQAHFVAVVCTNDLVIVDTAGNIKRIEALVQALDKGEPFKPADCAARPAVAGEPKT